MFTLRVAAASLLLLAACDEECSYVSRCRGVATLQTCRETWEEGNRTTEEERTACEAPNASCVQLDPAHARCAVSAEERCGADFAEGCRGEVAVRCRQGYVVGQDCAAHGNVCAVVGDAALCALAPLAECDPQAFVERCEGDAAYVCDTGVVERFVCEGRCRLTTEERGGTAWCD